MAVDQSRHENVVGIAWYKPTQWKRLLRISEDSEALDGTYLEWSDAATDAIRALARAGLRVQRVDIDVERLLAWCAERDLPVNSESRSRYLGDRLRKEYL